MPDETRRNHSETPRGCWVNSGYRNRRETTSCATRRRLMSNLEASAKRMSCARPGEERRMAERRLGTFQEELGSVSGKLRRAAAPVGLPGAAASWRRRRRYVNQAGELAEAASRAHVDTAPRERFGRAVMDSQTLDRTKRRQMLYRRFTAAPLS